MSGDTVHSIELSKLILGLDVKRFLATFTQVGPEIAALHALIGGTAGRPNTMQFMLVFCRLFDQVIVSASPHYLTPTQVEKHLARMCAANHHHTTPRGTDFDLTELYAKSLAELAPCTDAFRNAIARLYARCPSPN